MQAYFNMKNLCNSPHNKTLKGKEYHNRWRKNISQNLIPVIKTLSKPGKQVNQSVKNLQLIL